MQFRILDFILIFFNNLWEYIVLIYIYSFSNYYQTIIVKLYYQKDPMFLAVGQIKYTEHVGMILVSQCSLTKGLIIFTNEHCQFLQP